MVVGSVISLASLPSAVKKSPLVSLWRKIVLLIDSKKETDLTQQLCRVQIGSGPWMLLCRATSDLLVKEEAPTPSCRLTASPEMLCFLGVIQWDSMAVHTSSC